MNREVFMKVRTGCASLIGVSDSVLYCALFEVQRNLCYAGRAFHSCNTLAWFNYSFCCHGVTFPRLESLGVGTTQHTK